LLRRSLNPVWALERIMSRDIRESDWKTFRELRLVALERFCERALNEMERIRSDKSKTFHKRYLAIFEVLNKRDREVANAFDDVRRSTAVMQLAIIDSYDLLTEAELSRFSDELRERIAFLRNERT
jgi:hypothetical protein